jgi:hypothetical protein
MAIIDSLVPDLLKQMKTECGSRFCFKAINALKYRLKTAYPTFVVSAVCFLLLLNLCRHIH